MPELNAIALPAGPVRTIEGLAMRAWPARLEQPLYGWRLAFGHGPTRPPPWRRRMRNGNRGCRVR